MATVCRLGIESYLDPFLPDDWVLLLYLVGNDFIPHLPNLHIDKGGLPMLFTAYKQMLASPGMDCVPRINHRISVRYGFIRAIPTVVQVM